MAERQDQVQSLAIPLAAPIIAAYILGITVLSQGNPPPTYFKVLAYLPPTAPFAMTALVGLGATTWWQFVLSALLTAASVVVVARLAATVYRRAILRTGRRVRLREVISDRAPQTAEVTADSSSLEPAMRDAGRGAAEQPAADESRERQPEHYDGEV
jgi:ABC-2 type transport system permease protein